MEVVLSAFLLRARHPLTEWQKGLAHKWPGESVSTGDRDNTLTIIPQAISKWLAM